MATVDNKEQGAEKEVDSREVFQEILKLHESVRGEQKERGADWIERRINELPDSAKKEIRDLDKQLAEDGVPEEKRGKYIDREVVRFEQSFVEKRFTVGNNERMLKEEYSKGKTIEWVKQLLDEKPALEDLDKVARLSFDANGLKAVNDLSGSHEKGTEYLKRIAEVFHAKDSPAREVAAKIGITEILPVTGGGDEYSIMVKAEKPLRPEDLEALLQAYTAAIDTLDVSDLVDFKDQDTQLRYLGISRKEFSTFSEDKQKETLEQVRREIPAGFKMRASVGSGAATLREGLLNALKDPRSGKRLTMEDKDYDKVIAKMVGGTWDVSDASEMENKSRFKEALRAPDADPKDKFYSKVLARTTEVRIMENKLNDAYDRLRVMNEVQNEVAKLDLLRESLGDAAVDRNIRELLLKKFGQTSAG